MQLVGGRALMSPKIETLKLFLASPGDLNDERNLFPEVVQLLNDIVGQRMNYQLVPVGWENTLPGWGRPQALINQDVRECDVFIMLLWKRWGMPSGAYTSGSEEEFQIAFERYQRTGSPHLLLYFRSVPQDMMADPGEQLLKVIAFRTRIEVERIGLFKAYNDPLQWRDLLIRHISGWLYRKVDSQDFAIDSEKQLPLITESRKTVFELHQALEESKHRSKTPTTTESHLRSEAVAYAVKAAALIAEGKLTLAEQSFARSLEIYEEPRVLNDFGLFLYQIGSLDRAESLFVQAVSLSADAKTDAISYASLGDIYLTQGESDRALEMYENALELNTGLNDEDGMADSYGRLGVVYTLRGKLDIAEEMHTKALAIDTRINRKEGMAIGYSKLGNVFLSRGDFKKAQSMYELALEIDIALGRQQGLAKDYLGLGNIALLNGDFQKADDAFRRTLEINVAIGRKEGIADAHGSLGNFYMASGNLEKAEENYQRALDFDSSLGRLAGIANSYGNLGLVKMRKGDLELSEVFLKRALDIDNRLDRKEGIADDYDNLATMYRHKGDLDLALELWGKALRIYADLQNTVQTERIKSLIEGA